MIFVVACCESNISVKFLLWIVCVSGNSVNYFHKNPERNISVVQLLS